ncbi:MAG: sigma-54-dependent Fis family transcriptional regulator [Planctomycetales bacterium]|nr:sigma-54-dependent Fis family transcriptional regulator [Planctomycetales bacterium]
MIWEAVSHRETAEVISQLAHANPFHPDRLRLERQILEMAEGVVGDRSCADEGGVAWEVAWSLDGHPDQSRPELGRIERVTESLLRVARDRLVNGETGDNEGRRAYEDVALYLIYERVRGERNRVAEATDASERVRATRQAWESFCREYGHWLQPLQKSRRRRDVSEWTRGRRHIFAGFYQVRRAFNSVYRQIIGQSRVMTRLRAQVWESIFTHDMRRYRSNLYRCLRDVPTLVLGASGTGKELVARAIGTSQYLPFDEQSCAFEADPLESFVSMNVSAFAATLVESELFGHVRGAFTGATEDRAGWLELCGSYGAIFLDEIGELDASIQVKLLRVLQHRKFQRVGESRTREFGGKLIAATNRDLSDQIALGRFREDLYYRLCGDIVVTPTLAEQLADHPQDLRTLVLFLARRIAGPDVGEGLAAQTTEWIHARLGNGYRWPGNIRELEQCVCNIMVRNQYLGQLGTTPAVGHLETLMQRFSECQMTVDELVSEYCKHAYRRLGTYEEAGRRLGLDRRTVAKHVG